MPRLTVIIPTFKRPGMLRRALNSVLRQTYVDLVVRVFDNASGDETAEVVQEIQRGDPRVYYHCQSENVGLARNFAAGVPLVDTPFFTFLADDDLVLPHAYETLMRCFDDRPETMVSCGDTLHVIAPRQLYDLSLLKWTAGEYAPPTGAFEVLSKGMPFWSAMIFRREVVQQIGPVDPETGSLIDLDFILRCSLRCSLFVDKTPCAIYFSHPDAVSRIKHLSYVWPGWLKMTQNAMGIGGISMASRTALQRALHERLVFELAFAAVGCIRKGRYDEGREGGRILRRHTGRRMLGLAIEILAVSARIIPGVARAMSTLNDVRRWRSSRQINLAEFSKHLRHLE